MDVHDESQPMQMHLIAYVWNHDEFSIKIPSIVFDEQSVAEQQPKELRMRSRERLKETD